MHVLTRHFGILARRFRLMDPGYDSLVKSLQITFASLIGILYWVYIKPPNPFYLMLVPALLVMLSFAIPSGWNRLECVIVAATLMAVTTFLVSVLYFQKFLLLIFIFSITFAGISLPRYRFVAALALVIGMIGACLQPGWHAGVNRAITVGLSLAIALAVALAFSGLSQTCIRAVLVLYTSELALLVCAMVQQKEGMYRGVPLSDIKGRLAAVAMKANLLINTREYVFRKDSAFATHASQIFLFLRGCGKDIAFLENYTSERTPLLAAAPLTERVAHDLDRRLTALAHSLRSARKHVAEVDFDLYDRWRRECRERLSKNGALRECTRVVYGMDCLADDIAGMENSLSEVPLR